MTADPMGQAADPGGSCPSCGSGVFGDEVFCEACGYRLRRPERDPAPTTPTENLTRLELVLDGAAAVSDRGRRRTRNEDAVGVAGDAAGADVSIAVVCDGVGSTTDAHLAARVAADAAVAALESALVGGDHGEEAVVAAFGPAFSSAQAAVATVPFDRDDPHGLPPSTTMVAAVVVPGLAVVASVGDSRAYWLPASGAGTLLTVDDSLGQEQIAEGVDPETALAGPDAQAITRWIGVDAESVEPRVTCWEVEEPGRLVVCTDGLWNYFTAPDDLAALVASAPEPSPLAVARAMVTGALGRGGGDNITVAVVDGRPGVRGAAAVETGPPAGWDGTAEEGPP